MVTRKLIISQNSFFDINKKKQEILNNLKKRKQIKRSRPPLPKFNWDLLNNQQCDEMYMEFEDFELQQENNDNQFKQQDYHNWSEIKPVQQQLYEQKQQEEQNQLQNTINSQCLQQEYANNGQINRNIDQDSDLSENQDSTTDESPQQDNVLKCLNKKQIKKIEELRKYLNDLINQLKNEKYIEASQEIEQRSERLIIQVIQEKESLFKKKSQKTFVAAVIVLASRIEGEHLTSRKISKFIDCKEKTLNKQMEELQDNLPNHFQASNLPQAKDILQKFLTKFAQLNIEIQNQSQKLQKICEQILFLMQNKMLLQGNSPITLAAVALKIGAHLICINKSFKYFADLAQVCQISIRNCYQVCLKNIDFLLQNAYIKNESLISPSQLPDPKQQHYYY
ncbi:Cyclin-like protein [Pseudocohnilembus persalinus]|uniref:Cyclin-like protein n=1 Tax=Pseudocohnilembus persalinus TaxID=266149 RepID=A0A0V0QYZ2_PSEPJ|nr:Cyclin-like protein [Pseudocohnilembus persalinus]|eukprot:KRX07109.1 Cyclin-like protein [Pseudocohnilembus persalinus]